MSFVEPTNIPLNMPHSTISIRPFIGAKDYETSRQFYRTLGFEEVVLSVKMSLFKNGQTAFYLQNAFIKDWVDNSMIFLEVNDVNHYWREISALNLPQLYEGVRLSSVHEFDWGKECFLHDPSGILWHIGEFNRG